jgi:allantoinase
MGGRQSAAGTLIRGRPELHVVDYGSAVVGPGLIDTHVHMNEPGREEWEGMLTATAGAAAGGITTVVDMPLNSDPCTTSVKELKRKASIAQKQRNKTFVDVGFWAGLVPANAHNPKELEKLVRSGALGFKAFLAPSGINDFPHASLEDVAAALPVLRSLGVPLLVHAELVDNDTASDSERIKKKDAPRAYSTWLAARPAQFEHRAVAALIHALERLPSLTSRKDTSSAGFSLMKFLKKPKPSAPLGGSFAVHVVHMSDAEAVAMVVAARGRGLPISAETCPHYLLFASEEIKNGDTRFKCAPPIRTTAGRKALRAALVAGNFNGLASDHSPSPPSMKALDSGDFMAAWGGIAGLQYGLPATWEVMRSAKLTPVDLHRLWSTFPAGLAGLSRHKGKLNHGMYADIVVWDPEARANTSSTALQHRHKLTPYADLKLHGRVLATFVRGSQVFDDEKGVAFTDSGAVCGRVFLGRDKP